jgi:two-component system NtrC family sensor kinase
MADGVAHELNNPLTGVLTFAHLVARKVPSDSQEMADLRVIIGETNRCARIIRDLLQFARETEPHRKPEDLNEIIRETLSILQPQALFHDIRVQMRLADSLPAVVVDAGQIRQVLMNILLNAAEAMPEGGELIVTTDEEPEGKVYISKLCPQCGRTYEGNFPMWVQIGPFPCICGATVPAPRNPTPSWDR